MNKKIFLLLAMCTLGVFWADQIMAAGPVVNKEVRNLSSGMMIFSNSVAASVGDIVQYRITVQSPYNQTLHNVMARDYFPLNLGYYNNLTIDGIANGSNISTSNIYLGDMMAGQIKTIAYQAQVGSNVSYGASTITNAVNVSSAEGNSSATASVFVNNSAVLGATLVPTGLTDSLLNSFFLPLILLAGAVVGYSAFRNLKKTTT